MGIRFFVRKRPKPGDYPIVCPALDIQNPERSLPVSKEGVESHKSTLFSPAAKYIRELNAY